MPPAATSIQQRMQPVPLAAVRRAVHDLDPEVPSRPPGRIRLDWNESRWPLPEGLERALAEAVSGADPRPYPDESYPPLRRRIAEIADWTPEGVVFGSGGDEMLALTALALTGPGTVGWHPDPGFAMYPWAITLAGGRPIPFALDEELRYDLPALARRAAAESPSLITVNSPHNPSGESLSLDGLREVAAAAPGFLLIDEAYHEFAGASARELLDEFGNVLLLRTFSKALALAGARLGYVLGHPDAIRLIRRCQHPFPVGVYTARAAATALEHRPALLRLVDDIRAERESLTRRLAALPGVTPWRSRTNFVLARAPRPGADIARDLQARGIGIRHYPDSRSLRMAIRVTVGTPEENREFLAAFRETLDG